MRPAGMKRLSASRSALHFTLAPFFIRGRRTRTLTTPLSLRPAQNGTLLAGVVVPVSGANGRALHVLAPAP